MFTKDGLTSHGRPFSAYTSSLTWAETYSGSAVHAAGIKSIFYTNPNRQGPGETMYTSDETTFAHTCANARIKQTGSTYTVYLMDPLAPNMVKLYTSYVKNELSQQYFDAIFDDDADDYYALAAMPCSFNTTTWLSAYIAEEKALLHPVFYNGLGIFSSTGGVSSSMAMNAGAIGGMAEACYSTEWGPQPIVNGSKWLTFENTEIAMAQQNKIFICYSNDLATASTAIAARIYVYASFLLTYNVNTSLLWEYFGTTSGYTVEPESKLVALSPAIATPSSITGLRTSTGVYARKYGACYIGGTSVGACAVVVNSDNVYSHAFPYTGYHHSLSLSGGGILDSGTVSAKGAAPPANLAPRTAVIAFQ